MRLATQRRASISMAAAFAALVCFFLPWFQLSCGTQQVASVSGWRLAIGRGPFAGRDAVHLDVLVLMGVLLVLILWLGWFALRGLAAVRAGAILQIAVGTLSVLIPLVEFARLRSQVRGSEGTGLMGVATRFGFWGMLLSGGLITLLGYKSLRNKPILNSPPGVHGSNE